MEAAAGSEAKGEKPSSASKDGFVAVNQVDVEAVEVMAVAEIGSEGKSPEPTSLWGRLCAACAEQHAKKLENKDDWKNIPEMSYFQLFMVFFSFGARAFGGPIAQIALMKDELVTQNKWISETKFIRAYAVYQIVPGPEAMELACWFGYLAKGRFGAFLGGLGFLLPGMLLMLLISYIYVTFGLKDGTVQASFHCIQVAVSAIIFRATYKLGDAVVKDKVTKAPFSFINFYMILWCFLVAVINLNFFIGIATTGIMNAVLVYYKDHPYKEWMAIFCSAFTIGFYILYVRLNGWPEGSMIGDTAVGDKSLQGLFVLGLVAGCVSFGGAYTTLPFIYTSAVTNNGWLTQEQFLDALAITNSLPTPLVSFVTLPGFIGGGIGGAILIAIGIFTPAFFLSITGHELLEFVIDLPLVEPFLDGVGVGVVGLLIQTCFLFLKAAVKSPLDACVFSLSLSAAFHFTDKFTQPLILLVAAIAGQALYA